MKGTGLGPERTNLIRLSSVLAARDPEALARVLSEALDMGLSGPVEEVILQSYLFLGYPVALNAFKVWRDLGGTVRGDVPSEDWPGWSRRGEEVCRTVYGGQYEGLRRNVRALHPDLERWMVVEGYGKVLGRPGLDLATRELCIAALLAVLGAPRQLYSHLRGALNAGAGTSEVESAMEIAFEQIDPEGTAEALEVWSRVRARARSPRPYAVGS